MLVIRFSRVGRHNYPQYRIVVQEKTKAPKGKHVAIVGSYNPHTKEVVLKEDLIKEYLANGAQPSDSVYNLFVTKGVIEGDKRVVKIPEKKTEEAEGAEETVEEKTENTSDSAETPVEKEEEKKEETVGEAPESGKKEEAKEEKAEAVEEEKKEEIVKEEKKEEEKK